MVCTPTTRFVPHPGVVSAPLGNGDLVLLHLDKRSYYSLNRTGERIWRLMSDGSTAEEIASRLETEYDVTPARARQSVTALLDQLQAEGLVLVKDGG